MRVRIATLACAALLAGTTVAAAQTSIDPQTGMVYHRAYPSVTGEYWAFAPRGLRSDNPPGAAFQDRGIREDNGDPPIW